MNLRPARWFLGLVALPLLTGTTVSRAAEAAPNPKPAPIRRARTGHVTNYDEAKVGTYVLPDPLRLNDGEPVRDAQTWFVRRRPEILAAYESEVFGRIPANPPLAHVEVIAAGERVTERAAIRTHVIVHFGSAPDGPKADVVLYRPAKATKAPVLLQLVFRHGLPSGAAEPAPETEPKKASGAPETGPLDQILARGYAYATFRYTDVQPDRAGTGAIGVIGLARRSGTTTPAPDEWGSITAWAWAASRVLDYLASVPELDGTRVAIIGHSRLGKTVLWASALDPRFALVFSSCSGEMGAALSRRDYGETIDDMAGNFPWQFAANFQRYAGHWSELPVDAHCLIALSAPRLVLITGGTDDQWADPRGEFLAELAAGPVYRLLGKSDLGTTTWPGADHPLVSGALGWNYHTGAHAILPEDWRAFLDFADRNLK